MFLDDFHKTPTLGFRDDRPTGGISFAPKLPKTGMLVYNWVTSIPPYIVRGAARCARAGGGLMVGRGTKSILKDGVLWAGGPGAAEAYLGFLKAGGSKYPLDALKSAGVDLATPAAVETAFGVLSDLIERLDELVN